MGVKVHSLTGYKKRDSFGYAVVIGDVNGDNKNEVIVASTSAKGAIVNIFSGTTFKRLKTFYIGEKKVSTIRLLAKDINNDNIDEIIVAVTYQDLSGEVKIYSLKAGKVLYHWKSPAEYDAFGFALASGDFDGDGIADVVVSAPQPIKNGKGKVYAFSGKDGKLIKEFSSFMPTEYSNFGTSLAAGDTNGDGIDEIIIGAPGTPRGEVLMYSARYGYLTYKLTGEDSGFGILVHVDDINGDGIPELIVTTKKLEGNRVEVYQNGRMLYEIENDEVDIGFGETMTTGDINGDGIKEIIIGAFDSNHRLKRYAGQVNVYQGTDGKLLHRWHGKKEKDQFGFSLYAGKLKNGPKDSLVIGAPREILGKQGIVYVASLE